MLLVPPCVWRALRSRFFVQDRTRDIDSDVVAPKKPFRWSMCDFVHRSRPVVRVGCTNSFVGLCGLVVVGIGVNAGEYSIHEHDSNGSHRMAWYCGCSGRRRLKCWPSCGCQAARVAGLVSTAENVLPYQEGRLAVVECNVSYLSDTRFGDQKSVATLSSKEPIALVVRRPASYGAGWRGANNYPFILHVSQWTAVRSNPFIL